MLCVKIPIKIFPKIYDVNNRGIFTYAQILNPFRLNNVRAMPSVCKLMLYTKGIARTGKLFKKFPQLYFVYESIPEKVSAFKESYARSVKLFCKKISTAMSLFVWIRSSATSSTRKKSGSV